MGVNIVISQCHIQDNLSLKSRFTCTVEMLFMAGIYHSNSVYDFTRYD